MTANEKYLKGMEMVKAGKEPAEIVEALGYKDKQAWWAARCYFQNQKLTKRAAETKPETPSPRRYWKASTWRRCRCRLSLRLSWKG